MSWAAASDFAHPTMPQELAASDPANLRSQAEHIQHGGAALVVKFRCGEELGPRRRARPRCDRDILLAVYLECHRGRAESRADVDLPELFEGGIVEGRDGAVEERDEDQPAGGGERARVVRVRQ